MNSAPISEIYASVQGEGPWAGERQIFVRLAGCPLRCRYCDTPASLVAAGTPRKTVDAVVANVLRLKKSGARTVSVTGGEPLVYAPFVRLLFDRLKKKKFRTYLETAGIHAKGFALVVGATDVVSMDVKLPSATGRVLWREHAAFLRAGGKKIFVKIVIEKKSNLLEIKKAVALLTSLKNPPVLIFQPATPIEGQVEGPGIDQVADAYAWAVDRLPSVFVMPQQHKIWGAR